MSLKQSLSLEQQQAAFMCAAPVCILAGAGSGKTRVITHRIAYLVREHKVRPQSILGVTFTNKAAREMRERVEQLLPHQGNDVLLGTFHGLAARFLRYYGDLIGISRDFLIYDEDDATRLIKKIINERYKLSKEELSAEVKKVLRRRDGAKEEAEYNSKLERVDSIVALYQERLKKIGALDFSSLLIKFCELLENPEGARILCGRIRHVVVDEYQDVNAIQARIINILAENADSVAIVGDDDQSIYGWRGACASFMQKFLTNFAGAQLYKLEENYRSTKPILDAANALIAHNTERLGKNLLAIRGDGPLIGLKQHYRDNQEAQAVIEQVSRLFQQHGKNYEIAVLMRTNAQSRPLEEALHKARMPYRMVGGMRFYDRKEIKDILAALRAVLYQQSDVDILRLLNALPLGIGKKTQDALSYYAGTHNLSLYETMNTAEHQADALGTTRSHKKISNLIENFNQMRSEIISTLPNGEVKILRADEALIYVIDQFGIASRLENKNDEESEGRLENIEQLVQAAVSFVEDAESRGEPSDAQTFLENVALISKDESVNEQDASHGGTLTLMTLHAAKGLEFDAVFLVGLEEGVLPHSRSFHGNDEEKRRAALEEERRLLYVGITRARLRLFLSFCQERFMHGKTSPSEPSRFLKELPLSVIEPNAHWILDRNNKTQEPPKVMLRVPTSSAYKVEYDDKNIAVGTHVYHANYHKGKVVSLSGAGKVMRAQVRFEDDGQLRTIMLTHLKPA
jgi:DNA helicase-2/ATP-dependent DNA helicase PcrA